MKSPLCVANGRRVLSSRIVHPIFVTASLWLLLTAVNPSANAQTSNGIPAAATTAPSPADWTQFHRDNMQRWNPYETVLGVNNVGGLQVKWKQPGKIFQGTPESSPAIANGVVYFGTDEGNVYALDSATGALLWSYATGDSVFSSPAVANGIVYAGSQTGILYALNASTGALLWTFATQSSAIGTGVASSPAVANGVVYFGSEDSNVYALNASTGAKLWNFTTGSSVPSSPAVANGMVYFGSEDGNMYAVNATTGAKVWSHPIGGTESSPVVANGAVFIGSDGLSFYAFNASNGNVLWDFVPGSIVRSTPAVANGVVYLVADSGANVYAVNASTGAQLWMTSIGDLTEASPAVANGVVYINSKNTILTAGSLYALNASTGAKLWSYALGAISSSPTIVDGVLYFRSGNPSLGGNTYAFSLGSADLSLRVQPSTATVHQGDLLTYTFPVWNHGPSNAVHEVLSTQVPAGTTFDYLRVSGTPGLAKCTTPPYQGTGQIVCHENGIMAPSTTWTVRLTVKVTAPSGSVITESAATTADTPDPNLANNTATASVNVQ